MWKLSPRRAPLGWVAGALLIVVGFVVGVTVTSGGGRGHAVMGGLETPASAAGPMAGQSQTHTYADVAELAMPAVVNISTDKVVKAQEGFQHPFMEDPMFRQFFQMPDNQQQDRVERSLGSGVIVSDDGYILTSNHVIAAASKIRVLMKDKQEYEAKIIGQDEGTDVALIKIEATGLPAVRLGDSSVLRIGDQVMAIGNPLGVGQTVTVGIVSALGRSIGLMDYEDFIQTDAAINRGNSGGALVNMDGDLVGINTAILSPSGGSIGIGFSIPSVMAKRVMDSLLKDGKVTRAWLGVQVQDVDQALAEAHDLDKPRGVLVADVTKGAPGAKAGLKEGDIILSVDGKSVNDRAQLRNRISLAGVGETVRLALWREGREMPLNVKLEALPADAPGGVAVGRRRRRGGRRGRRRHRRRDRARTDGAAATRPERARRPRRARGDRRRPDQQRLAGGAARRRRHHRSVQTAGHRGGGVPQAARARQGQAGPAARLEARADRAAPAGGSSWRSRADRARWPARSRSPSCRRCRAGAAVRSGCSTRRGRWPTAVTRVCLIGQPGGEITRRAAASGLRVRPLKMGGILVPWTLAALRAILVRERVTVACVNQDREVHLTALASAGLPGFRLVPRRGSPDPIKGKPFYRYSYARRVDRLIVNCAALGDKVCARAPWFDRAKLRVVHNGIDAEAFAATARRGRVRAELGLAPDRLVVSLVGEVGWRKGQAVLLEAVARLHANGAARDAVFLIAGEGSGRAELEARARALGLADGTVRFLGFRHDVPDLLADTDLLVLPSFRGGLPQQPCSRGWRSACRSCRPPVDGIPELVVDGVTGVLTPPGDAPALAAAIGALLGDAARRRALGEAGRARARAEFADTKLLDAVENCLTAWGPGGR